jgi:hypothetical protein
MPETKQMTFSYKEVAEALVKQAGLEEGVWGLYLEFGISGANVEPPGGHLTPAAIVPVVSLGLQRFDEENNLSVDAGKLARTKRKTKQTTKK